MTMSPSTIMSNPLDIITAALCILREAEGESVEGKTGVWMVIQNRVMDPRSMWPSTIHGVVTQPYQFSSFNANDGRVTVWPNEKQLATWKAWLDCLNVISTTWPTDITNGATFYHDDSIAPPFKAWLGPNATLHDLLVKRTLQSGRLNFYKI